MIADILTVWVTLLGPAGGVTTQDGPIIVQNPPFHYRQPSSKRRWTMTIVAIVVFISLAIAILAAVGLQSQQAHNNAGKFSLWRIYLH